MTPEIETALYDGQYICPVCARDDKLIKLVALTRHERVFHCVKCLINVSNKTLDKWIDSVDA